MSRSAQLLSDFVSNYAFQLDDFQLHACQIVANGDGVLVAAPTGAGKTVVGEFAIHTAVASGRKCFYTTPIKALSNQKYHNLVCRYGEAKVGLLTGDVAINSDAQIVVMTTEVLRNMIYAQSVTLLNLGFVVMDEVHYLADRFRGPVWEEIIIGLPESVQLIALSATVSNAEEFGEWLNLVRGSVKVVISETRPVPLYQHVLVKREIYDLFDGIAPTALTTPELDRKQATQLAVNPNLVRISNEESRIVRDDSRAFRSRSGRGKRHGHAPHGRYARKSPYFTTREDMIRALKRHKLLPAICFIFSRMGCDQAVSNLSNLDLHLTNIEEQLRIQDILHKHMQNISPADLEALDYRYFSRSMLQGIAAHHAGMLPAFKAAVEEAFVQGLIKIVFATETLALGINMPAKCVVVEKLAKFNGETTTYLTPGEYTQLTGRAGRRGIDVEGHAVVMWQPGMSPKAVAGLASRRTYPLNSAFKPTYNMAVNLVQSVGKDRARKLLELSFAQFQADKTVTGGVRKLNERNAQIESLWQQAASEYGDMREYALLRAKIKELETQAARARKADKRAESISAVRQLMAGDIIWWPDNKNPGWAVVLGISSTGSVINLLTLRGQTKQLQAVELKFIPQPAGRVRIPKHTDIKQSRRTILAALNACLQELGDIDPQEYLQPAADLGMDPVSEFDIQALRIQMKSHPVHHDPKREILAVTAAEALRLERERDTKASQHVTRKDTIAKQFDRICLVLEALGYLTEGGKEVTEPGRKLSRIYSELDLVAAEAVRRNIFEGLTEPALAAACSTLVYESRNDGAIPWLPDAATEDAVKQLRRLRREIGLLERDHRIPRNRELDLGFAAAIHAWTAGQELNSVLHMSRLNAGDFVRWVRMCMDFLGQIATAAGSGQLHDTAKNAIRVMRRGVVAQDMFD